MSLPQSSMRPESGRSSPAMRFSSVDLPMPDSPMTATYSPGASSSEMSARTVRGRGPGKDLETARSDSIGRSARLHEPERHAVAFADGGVLLPVDAAVAE